MKTTTSMLKTLAVALPLSLAAAGVITITAGVASAPPAQAFGWSDVTGAVSGIAKEAKRAAKDFGKTVGRDVKRAGKAVGRGAKAVGRGAKDWATSAGAGVKDIAKGGKWVGERIGGGAKLMADDVRTGVAVIGKGGRKAGKVIWNGVRDCLPSGCDLDRPGVPLDRVQPSSKLPPSRLSTSNRMFTGSSVRTLAGRKAGASKLPPARAVSLPSGDSALPPARGSSAAASGESRLPPPRRRKVQGITKEDLGIKETKGSLPRDKSVWGRPVGKGKHDVARDKSVFGNPVGVTSAKDKKRISKTRDLKLRGKLRTTVRKLNAKGKKSLSVKGTGTNKSLKLRRKRWKLNANVKVFKHRKLGKSFERKDRRKRNDS